MLEYQNPKTGNFRFKISMSFQFLQVSKSVEVRQRADHSHQGKNDQDISKNYQDISKHYYYKIFLAILKDHY